MTAARYTPASGRCSCGKSMTGNGRLLHLALLPDNRRDRPDRSGWSAISLAAPRRNYISACRNKRNHIRRHPPHKAFDKASPCFECGLAFVEILKSVVDRGYAANRARLMVQHAVSDMRRDPESRHA